MATSEETTLEQCILASESASRRARTILIGLVIASVVAFFAYWNSREDSWIALRYRALVKLLGSTAASQPAASTAQSQVADIHKTDMSQWKAQIEAQALAEQLYSNVVLVRLPFIGVVFDVNDLAMFSGIAFLITLTLLLLSQLREYANTEETFALARRVSASNLKATYVILSMHQVLTVPPKIESSLPQPWRYSIRAMFCLPVSVMILIVQNDFGSFPVAYSLAPRMTLYLLGINAALTVAVGYMTVKCVRVSRRLDGLWAVVAAEIRNGGDRDGERAKVRAR